MWKVDLISNLQSLGKMNERTDSNRNCPLLAKTLVSVSHFPSNQDLG